MRWEIKPATVCLDVAGGPRQHRVIALRVDRPWHGRGKPSTSRCLLGSDTAHPHVIVRQQLVHWFDLVHRAALIFAGDVEARRWCLVAAHNNQIEVEPVDDLVSKGDGLLEVVTGIEERYRNLRRHCVKDVEQGNAVGLKRRTDDHSLPRAAVAIDHLVDRR